MYYIALFALFIITGRMPVLRKMNFRKNLTFGIKDLNQSETFFKSLRNAPFEGKNYFFFFFKEFIERK